MGMRLDEIAALFGGKGTGTSSSGGSGPDRLTLALAALALLLVGVLTLIVTDLLVSSWEERQLARAESTLAPALATASLPTPGPIAATPTAGTPPPCIAPFDWGTHVVQEGDTLYSIAQTYGTDFQSLKQVNCLEDSNIWIGQPLYVPGPLALPTVATPTPKVAQPPSIGTPPALDSTAPGLESAPTTTFAVTPLVVPGVTASPRTAFSINIPNQYINILLLGTDVNLRKNDGIDRTDSIIVVSVNTEDNTVHLLHVPRDLWVYIPGHGENRINTAYLWGELEEPGTGPEWVKRTIHYNLGIPIHYYILMHRHGFKEAIDTLGGVDVDVACPLPELNLEPGMHHLGGELAYEFVHTRETSNDYDRGRRQRKLLMALWEQKLTPDIIPKLPQLWVTMGDTFVTDLPLDQALNLARVAVQIDFEDIDTAAITNKHTQNWTTPEGWMVLRPRENEIRKLLEKIYNPVEPIERQEKQQKIRAQVLNGSSRPDADQLAAAELKREGFRIVGKGEGSFRDLTETQIIVRRGNLAVSERIALELGVPGADIQDETNLPEPPNPSDPVDVRIIVGQDYDPCQR
jgi:LCP family protein required for cell wall assembly